MATEFQRIRLSLLEEGACPFRPVSSKWPFPYHWIPGDLRIILGRIFFSRNLKRLRLEERVPRSYADNRVDCMIQRALPAHGGPSWQWPDEFRCALVLSHDVDTSGQTRGIERLRKVAEARGIRSTFSFVGETLSHYHGLIDDLRGAGHEIGLHDRYHDNCVAFLTEDAIRERLEPLREQLETYGIKGFRSPSWYVSATLWCALRHVGFRYDMSALDNWPFFHPRRNYGVASLFPFLVDGLAVLPNTIPYDDMPRFSGYSLKQIMKFWKPKLDWVACNRGLIMLNAHPDRWWSGSAKAAETLGATIDYILERHAPARLRAIDVAEHAFRESSRRATIVLPGSPLVEVPRHGPHPMVPFTTLGNPLFLKPAEFLRE
jgi:peptidoglycan/xylan/chitin deacetylase (PgdA/CDA1 family)